MIRNKGELYKSKVVEASSPISTRPGTPFRIGVLGLLEEDLCMEIKGTESEPLESKPYELPVIVDYRMPECELEVVDTDIIEGEVGDKFLVELDHGSNAPFLDKITYGETGIVRAVIKDGNLEVKLLEEFAGLVEFVVTYTNCLTCIFTLDITAFEPEEEEEPGEPGDNEPTDPPKEPEEPKEDDTPEITNKCPGIHTSAEARIRVGGSRKYLPTTEQREITADLQISMSDNNVVSITNSGAPDFKVDVTGTEVGVVYVKFLTIMKDGSTCQRISKFIVYDANKEPTDKPAPEGFQNKDNGVSKPATGSGGSDDEPVDRSGRDPVLTAGSVNEGLITPALLDKMVKGDIVMLLCNYTKTSGCKFDVEIGGEALATGVDIESGGRHKAVILNLPDKPSIENGGKVKLIAKANKQPEWGIHVMTYEHVKQYLDNNTALTESSGDIYNHKIAFKDTPSSSPAITETLTGEFILDM